MDTDQRLQLVEDRLDILQLEGMYSHTWDAGDGDGWAGLFTEDGVFAMDATGGRAAVEATGRVELRDFCVDFNRTTQGLHLLHTPDLRVDGDAATSWIHFQFRAYQAYDGAAGGELRETTGIYHVRYVRTAEGWRMARRRERAVGRGAESLFTGFYPAMDTDR